MEIRELKQHIVYLDSLLDIKEKEIQERHNEIIDVKYQINQELKKSSEKDRQIKRLKNELLDKDRTIIEVQK